MLKAHGTSSRDQRTTRVVLGTGHQRKLVPCWLMSSEINPGQFGSRMCREQLRSEQVLPEASRADRLAYDPERNTLQTPLAADSGLGRRGRGGCRGRRREA